MLSRSRPPRREEFQVFDFSSGQFVLKGTTNYGFIHDRGVTLGVDSRISTCTMVNGALQDYLVRDDKRKIKSIRGNFHGTIKCTLMGNVGEWRALYRWLNTQAVTGVGDAVLKVMDYLYWYRDTNTVYLEGYKAYYGFSISFGMLIGGYTTQEGHSLAVVYLDDRHVYWRMMDNAETLGSGAEFANQILQTSTCEDRRAYGLHRRMTIEEAMHLGLRTLSHSTVHDPWSGGLIREVHISGYNVRFDNTDSLESYVTLYHESDIEIKSIFVLYVWPYPVASDVEIQEMLNTVWPHNDVPLDDIQAWHYIAHRADIYIHRILFSDEGGARDAYQRVFPLATPGPDAILEGLYIDRFVIRSGVVGYPVYVGRSSLAFLQRMTSMPRPPSLTYPEPHWAQP